MKQSNKIVKPLARLTKIKGEKTQITNDQEGRGDITTDPAATGILQTALYTYVPQLR